MKSTSQTTWSSRIRSAMKKIAPLRTPTRSSSLPAYSAEISAASSLMRRRRSSSETSTSPIAAFSSACVIAPRSHGVALDEARDSDDLVPAHDDRPAVPEAARDLGVGEHVLELLPPAGEPIARSPRPYRQTRLVGLEYPRAPTDAALFEGQLVVFAHGGDPVREVSRGGALACRQEGAERLLDAAREPRRCACRGED